MEDNNIGFWDELSHEIRNSLHIIIGSSNLLRSGEYDNQVELVKNIQVSAKQLQDMLNSYLNGSKETSEKTSTGIGSVHLPSLVQDIASQHKSFAKEKNLNLLLDLDSKIPDALMGYQTKLVQVLNNLISNAIHYTDQGEVRLIVELLSFKTGAVVVRFQVADTGPGISDEDQEKLFNEFAQLESGAKEKGKRFGLGLMICKRILQSMNSEIKLESKPGIGSAFHFDLCFAPELTQSAVTLERIEHTLPDSKVLVVDDSPVNRFIMEKLLSKIGIECDAVGTGKEVFERLKTYEYSLLLMDVNLPDINGITLSSKLKEKSVQTRIILVSADEKILSSVFLSEIGIHTTLSKPFTPDELQFAITHELTREN